MGLSIDTHETFNIQTFLEDLADRLAEARASERELYQRFFATLAPRLEMARFVERELDRDLARRFNVFDYLRTDELGLSRIIADLLDPAGTHGQGALFLKALLDHCPATMASLVTDDRSLRESVIHVSVSLPISKAVELSRRWPVRRGS